VRVEWQARARQDTANVVAYIEIHDPAAALAVLREIRRQVAMLADHPHLGRPGRAKGTRELVINRTPYIAAYRMAGSVVQVIRILHGAQRWPKRF
jgi:toxin ParE1/3/4